MSSFPLDHQKRTLERIPRMVLILCMLGSGTSSLFAHQGEVHDSARPAESSRSAPMGFEEKPGSLVPLHLPFFTETGDTIRLSDAVHGPTVLAFLYYKCGNACNLITHSLAKVLPAFTDKPGSAPNVVMISIDTRETPRDALAAKEAALEALGSPYPPERWRFLTGPEASIRQVAEASGFHFVRKGEDFDHPIGLIILSPQGKVVRYILGTGYLPLDLTMSLLEAAGGTTQPTIARILRMCFALDPQSHRYVFRILQVSATVIVLMVSLFGIYLFISARRRRAKGNQP